MATRRMAASAVDVESGESEDTLPLVPMNSARSNIKEFGTDSEDTNAALPLTNENMGGFRGRKQRLAQLLRSPTALMALLAGMLLTIVLMSLQGEHEKPVDFEAEKAAEKLLPYTFLTLYSGLFQPQLAHREWVAGAKDGTYLVKDNGDLVLHHVDSKETTVLVSKSDLVIDKVPLQYSKYLLSPTLSHILFESNVEKGWRHSYFATYHLFDVQKKTLKALTSSANGGSGGTGSSSGTGTGTGTGTAGNSGAGAAVGSNGAVSVGTTSENATTDSTITTKQRKRQGTDNGTGKGGDTLGKGKIALAVWAENGDNVAWVRDNNIFVTSTSTETEVQITTDGSFDIMNGVADWVYEEEVLGGNVAMWLSPDGSKLAYLKFNDAAVPTYPVQLFFHESGEGQQYPDDINIKYPKAGTNNPITTLHIANPSATSALARDIPVVFSPPESVFPDDDRLIVECKWMQEADSLMVRMMNRVQDQQRLFLVRAPEESNTKANGTWIGTLVRDEKSPDGAWLTSNLQPIFPLRSAKSPGYLELAEEPHSGNMHIAHYTSLTAKTPSNWVTKGDYEVTSVSFVDAERGLVFYTATKESSMQRHLYSVKIGGGGNLWVGGGGGGETKLTPPSGITWTSSVRTWKLGGTGDVNEGIGAGGVGDVGWYDVSFSKGGGFYLLTYSGPDVPFQKVVSVHDSSINFPFKTNDQAAENLKKYAIPRELFTKIPIPGEKQTMNARIIVPNDFNPSDLTKKYPVLINVYGGPNSQTVTQKFSQSFETALAATGYIILYVDPRGTCCKGRAFRTIVSKQLGKFESQDVVAAAEWLIAQGFVDKAKVAVWGWSYGGFLAAKVIELGSGVINTGIAVAPVTDWKFYDSIYTERYMKTPLLNPKGYETSAVSNMSGFRKADFLLIHGTGDDNVHFQNSLALIWKLTQGQVHSYQVQFYPDSDHSMSAGNAFGELFELLRRFLDSHFGMLATSSDSTTEVGKKKRNVEATFFEEKHGVVSGIGMEWDVYDHSNE